MKENKKRILLVEDEEEMIKAIKLRLEANNYEVLVANDGISGVNLVHKERPDLIILDIMLPKMDGFAVARILKFDSLYENIPIIILSARMQKSDFAKGEEVKADAYITKPFKSEELLAKINQLIAKTD
jgi:DNA-binding response OmpR family regulator